MVVIRFIGLFLLASAACGLSAESPPVSRLASSPWEKSVVTIEVARAAYDYNQPWTRKTRRLRKTGVMVAERKILTTADQLYDRTLVRLQKNGRGQWFIGQVSWIDYPANLAIITTSEDAFWSGLEPAEISGNAGTQLQIVRWREGNFESRRAEFSQYVVKEGVLAPVSHAILEVSSDIQNAGWAEPVVAESRVVGMLVSQDGRTCSAMPAEFIQSVLAAHIGKTFRGLGFFHFYWQSAENTDSLAALGLTGKPRGVIVHMVPERPDSKPASIRERDIILRIDGFDLDIQGDYPDPELGYLNLENLATRKHWAGTSIKMVVWRDRKEVEVDYVLPKYRYSDALVPFAAYDNPPEYLTIGGLIFQPLNTPFLQNWGNEWKRRAPFRLLYYTTLCPTPEHPSFVLLSQVLPDPYNIGYQELKYLVLDRVNNQPVSTLEDLKRALASPVDGYHVIEFVRTDGLRRLVLAAGEAEGAATDRVLKRYGIPQPFQLNLN